MVLKYIKENNEYEFDYPDEGESLYFKTDEDNIVFACPGKGFSLTNNNLLKVKCVGDTKFKSESENEQETFDNYSCFKFPESSIVRNGQCAGNKSAFKIGFKVDEVFVKTIDICFDEDIKSALYSMHKIMPSLAG